MTASLPEILTQAEAYERELPALLKLLPAPRGAEIASWIDLTLLKPDATSAQVRKVCDDARLHSFATVCVNPVYVLLAKKLLVNSSVGVCTVISFPLGADLPEDKAHMTRRAIENGADEVDMVINIGALKDGSYEWVLQEILPVVQAAHSCHVKVKVIIEAALLARREKIIACLLSQAARADFIKTSTGFGISGATADDVELMRRVVGVGMGVKAAGGIRTYKTAMAMIAAGANRIGTSSGLAILHEALSHGA